METVSKLPAYVRLIRLGYALLASVFVACLSAQVFLAGLRVFAGLENWIRHASFVHIFEWLPPLMLLASFVGWLPGALHWLHAGLWALIVVQYLTANSPETWWRRSTRSARCDILERDDRRPGGVERHDQLSGRSGSRRARRTGRPLVR
jgi:hypothetical protein